ncbi:hypothetical protein BOS5A_10503 [Bosea sp. EC-HK365B]|nr:hypothetical protein BOSE21B_10571 [Bosea sp. 21B]CAD5265519.1 hypothetical protein BOSE7B_150567 [Bosea sp. 7B]VVT44529.1 hypothetical protein BOS5A_10503 [Bosea sp. EC-HK365B]VXB07387.1 hypothetical protein BOSE29B_10356 [Bosea sp. 29B]VXC47096.1 hypothetical protein BOSE127_190194 [Bosea sp. 127]
MLDLFIYARVLSIRTGRDYRSHYCDRSEFCEN